MWRPLRASHRIREMQAESSDSLRRFAFEHAAHNRVQEGPEPSWAGYKSIDVFDRRTSIAFVGVADCGGESVKKGWPVNHANGGQLRRAKGNVFGQQRNSTETRLTLADAPHTQAGMGCTIGK